MEMWRCRDRPERRSILLLFPTRVDPQQESVGLVLSCVGFAAIV